jgi:hypothetical protein
VGLVRDLDRKQHFGSRQQGDGCPLSGAGSVVAYNYMDDGYVNGSDGWVEIRLKGSHMVGGHHILFEGNQSFNIDSDQTHGN